MKICNSPRNTSCTYQRLARDQAPDEPDNNGAQAGAASDAYEALYSHLEASNDTEALSLLQHLMNTLTNDGAMDAPPPFSGRPNTGGAMDSAVRSGRRQASAYGFAQRFPGAARIRSLG